MKKRILMYLVAILFIGINAFAAGDLIVNGKLGVGTGTPMNALHVAAGNDNKAINASIDISSISALTNITAFYQTISSQTGLVGGRFMGFNGNSVLTGNGTVTALGGAENVVSVASSTGSYTIDEAFGNLVTLRRGTENIQNHIFTNYYGFYSTTDVAGSGQFSGTNWRHAYFEDFPDFGGTVTNVAGLWVDQQTRGTNNYGIVLDGDGAGSDIVFGPAHSERIYSNSGRLYAQDSFGNQTILSPHDPETGEWVYYSKNIKTGKVVRVDMERLVKAVEKLTGETFMLETSEKIK